MIPASVNIFPGDFFQITNGQINLLGNIFRQKLINLPDVLISDAIDLSPQNWNFSNGVTKPYAGRGTGQNGIEGEFEFSRQILAFEKAGSFIFKGNSPKAFKILDWNRLQDELIIKLTQTYFSFRQVYVVTEALMLDDWSLAISGEEDGELEIATEQENFGLVDIFGEVDSKTIQSKNLAYMHSERRRNTQFFKAKKLAVQDRKLDYVISELIQFRYDHQTWADNFYNLPLELESDWQLRGEPKYYEANVLDLLSGNQLNPNTVLDYFQWLNTSLDDIDYLFNCNE